MKSSSYYHRGYERCNVDNTVSQVKYAYSHRINEYGFPEAKNSKLKWIIAVLHGKYIIIYNYKTLKYV